MEPEKHNTSREALKAAVQRLLHSNEPMPFETVVQVGTCEFFYETDDGKHCMILIIDFHVNLM